MKKQLVALVSRSLLALLLTCGLAVAEDSPQLQKLKHTVLSPTSEQVVLQLNGPYSPIVFTLKDENPRVIFDFADMTYGREVKGVTTTSGPIVKRVRVGMHTDGSPKTRIVFDVATLKDVTYTQKFDNKSSSLVIQFNGPEKTVAPGKQETPKTATAAAKPPPPPSEAAETVASTPVQQAVPPKEPAEQPAMPQPQPSPAPVATAQPESPKPTAVAPKETTEAAVTTKAVEKPLVPMAPSKPEASVAAKPEKETKTTATPPVAGEKKEEKKVEPPAKEPTRPEAAGEPQVPAKADIPPTGDKGKTEAAKAAAALKTMEGAQLEYVKFDASSPKGEMVLFKLNGFHPPTVHGVEEGIPRVVCDFNNTKLIDATKSLIKADGKFVKVIRTTRTKKPEKVRVVIDLEPNRSYDLQQVFFKEDNLFVLIVNTVKK